MHLNIQLKITVALVFCGSSYIKAETSYLTRNEMIAYIADFSYPTGYYHYQYKYLFRKRKGTPQWRRGTLPVKRLNPEFKSELINIIKRHQTLKGEDKRLVYGALYLLGYLANENDLQVLEAYLQNGVSSIKKNNGSMPSYLEPIDFYDLGTCIGTMIARNIKGADKFYLKYGDSEFWAQLGVSSKDQMYIVNFFACKVHEMSKNPIAGKRALQRFIINGKSQCATLPEAVVNHDKMYKINRYMTLKNSMATLPPSMVKVFADKMKELHPNVFAYFGVKAMQPIASKQKIKPEQEGESSNYSLETADKPSSLKNIKNFSTAKFKDLEVVEKEAIKHYQIILNKFKKKDIKFILANIADNGKPVRPVNKVIDGRRYQSRGFLKDLDQTIVLINAIEALKPEYGPAIINISTSKAFINQQKGRSLLKRHNQKIIVLVPLLKTSKVTKKYKLRNSRRPPNIIDENGNIRILMIYQDGKWYWNPFGW